MNLFKQELNQIKPSDRLVMETMRRMRQENAALQAESEDDAIEDGLIVPPVSFWRRRGFAFVAAAACMLLLCTAVLLTSAPAVPMQKLQTDAVPSLSSAGNRWPGETGERALTKAEFGERAGLDVDAFLPGYSCISAESVAFVDEAGQALGDYGVFTYSSGTKRVTLYASTSDQTAPAELMLAEAAVLDGTEIRFGQVSGGVFYAAWVQNGTSLCMRSDALGRRAFIKLVESVAV